MWSERSSRKRRRRERAARRPPRRDRSRSAPGLGLVFPGKRTGSPSPSPRQTPRRTTFLPERSQLSSTDRHSRRAPTVPPVDPHRSPTAPPPPQLPRCPRVPRNNSCAAATSEHPAMTTRRTSIPSDLRFSRSRRRQAYLASSILRWSKMPFVCSCLIIPPWRHAAAFARAHDHLHYSASS